MADEARNLQAMLDACSDSVSAFKASLAKCRAELRAERERADARDAAARGEGE